MKGEKRKTQDNQRLSNRVDVAWEVDCMTEDTFLYASIRNISALGIFVLTQKPLEVGTALTLQFSPPHTEDSFALKGSVQWVNPVKVLADNRNPGMGISFVDITQDERKRLLRTISTLAYVRDHSN